MHPIAARRTAITWIRPVRPGHTFHRATTARWSIAAGHLRPPPASSSAEALAVATVTTDAGGRALQPTKLAGGIDPRSWPEIDASCHQSLLVLRSACRLANEPGRHLQLGVRNCLVGFACSCRRIMLEKLLPTVLATMASPLAGSDATGSSCLSQSTRHRSYLRRRRPPRRRLRPLRAICPSPLASVCGELRSYAPNRVRFSAPRCRRSIVKSGDNDCKSTPPAMPAPSMRHGSKPKCCPSLT